MNTDDLRFLIPYADEVIVILIVLLSAIVLSRVLRQLIERQNQGSRLGHKMVSRLHGVRRWTIATVALLFLLEAVGGFHSAWALLSTSIAALALGFVAAWSVLSNATAALLVMIFRPYRLGDHVELVEPNGHAIGGRVIEMNLMFTTLTVEQAAAGPQKAAAAIDVSVMAASTQTAATHVPGASPSAADADPGGQGQVVLRIPNNLFFQRVLRTHSSHPRDSREAFSLHDKH